MRTVQLRVAVPAAPDFAYEKIGDFGRYPELVDVVRAVRVHGDDSDWEVYFRNGILRWSETDQMDRAGRRISFVQTEGDFDHFVGHWCVEPLAGDGSLVHFKADFDFGIPSLAGILDPIAERTFRETVYRILEGLFGAARLVDPDGSAESGGADGSAESADRAGSAQLAKQLMNEVR
jgi:ribosome-associated toxin RatA of RatAB toxin-antitoxin module